MAGRFFGTHRSSEETSARTGFSETTIAVLTSSTVEAGRQCWCLSYPYRDRFTTARRYLPSSTATFRQRSAGAPSAPATRLSRRGVGGLKCGCRPGLPLTPSCAFVQWSSTSATGFETFEDIPAPTKCYRVVTRANSAESRSAVGSVGIAQPSLYGPGYLRLEDIHASGAVSLTLVTSTTTTVSVERARTSAPSVVCSVARHYIWYMPSIGSNVHVVRIWLIVIVVVSSGPLCPIRRLLVVWRLLEHEHAACVNVKSSASTPVTSQSMPAPSGSVDVNVRTGSVPFSAYFTISSLRESRKAGRR